MFSNLRTNSQFFILHKEEHPYVEIGTVVSVSAPTPKYTVPNNFMQSQEMVVDVVVSINDTNIPFKRLPANQEVADSPVDPTIVVTTNREAMNAEVAALKQKSLNVINNVNYHNNVISGCDSILQYINPEFAEKQQQKEEITILKEQVSTLMQSVSSLVESNKELMSKLGQKQTNT